MNRHLEIRQDEHGNSVTPCVHCHQTTRLLFAERVSFRRGYAKVPCEESHPGARPDGLGGWFYYRPRVITGYACTHCQGLAEITPAGAPATAPSRHGEAFAD